MLTWATKLSGWARGACTAIVAFALLNVAGESRLAHAPAAGVAHETAVGEVRHVLLEGGNRVDLNTDSEMLTRLETNRYTVALTRGEARFRVDRNDRVTLVVSAGAASVAAARADFSVRLVSNSRTDVLVKNGSVAVAVAPPATLLPRFWVPPAHAVTIGAGDSLSLQSNSVYVRERLSAAAVERRTAWTDGWLWFAADPLPQAIAEFNRYHNQHLVLVDPRLARLEIGGRFRSSDLDSFVAALERSFDVRTTSPFVPGTEAATIYLTERCPRALQHCN